jgi:hypothetical protein
MKTAAIEGHINFKRHKKKFECSDLSLEVKQYIV